MGLGKILRRSADKFPGKTALIFHDRRISYHELNRRVNCIANTLLENGLKKKDRLAVILHNCPEFIEIYFAAAKSGAVFVPINNLLKRKELHQILQYIKPRYLVIDPEYEEIVRNMQGDVSFIEKVYTLHDPVVPSFSSYKEFFDKKNFEEPEVAVSDEDLISIFLTSGTTGLPKGAMRTHLQNFVNAMTASIEMKLDYTDRAVLLFPLYHVTFEDHLRHFLMGNTVLIRREGSFSPREILEILEKERITVCQFVPTMINSMLQEKSIEQYDLTHLRIIPYAASPMPVELLKRAMQRFKCKFIQFYGQTETGPLTTTLRPEDHLLEGSEEQLARLASAGRAVLDYEVRVVDADGKDVPIGEVGEIVVRSEAMTTGYWDLPDETAKTIRNGWLHTGDFGRLDEEKYVYIVDRKNDLIISGGKNIYPREIEELLYQHEAVLEAAVIGVPDDYWGESVKALVVLKPGKTSTEEDMIAFCREHLASYKKPRSVEFRAELPKNPTGKVLKRVLREKFWEGRSRLV